MLARLIRWLETDPEDHDSFAEAAYGVAWFICFILLLWHLGAMF